MCFCDGQGLNTFPEGNLCSHEFVVVSSVECFVKQKIIIDSADSRRATLLHICDQFSHNSFIYRVGFSDSWEQERLS